jgi:hypothetical protein
VPCSGETGGDTLTGMLPSRASRGTGSALYHTSPPLTAPR